MIKDVAERSGVSLHYTQARPLASGRRKGLAPQPRRAAHISVSQRCRTAGFSGGWSGRCAGPSSGFIMSHRVVLLAAAIVGLYVLHQDLWLWRAARPLVFGFLPVGLAYHAAYCLLVALLMWAMTRNRLAGAPRTGSRAGDSRAPGLRLPRGRPLHRHLRVQPRAGAAAAPRTTSSPAARSARRCSCCRCSAPT